ncbi:MAG: hypothetical protein KBT03_02590 [Bacteroidales bacterium]|nr:hypothetical protein [Candidatus Scybalousia scybalohippi]
MGSGVAIKKAIKKYGIENFNKEYLAFCDKEEKLNWFERFYIKKYDSKAYGYNMTDGGEGATGYKYTSEQKKKRSESLIGNTRAKGHKLSDISKEKIGNIHKGLKHSEETKKKMSEAKKGRIPWNKGKHLSEEHIKNLSHPNKPKQKLTSN